MPTTLKEDKTLSILIVEDSESDVDLIAREFREAGYRIVCERAQTADQMEAAIKGRSWDLVIADYSLTEFNAPSALIIYKQAGLDIPFIVVSGTIGEEAAVAVLKSGAHDCVMKKNLVRLVPAAERELSEAETRRKNRLAEELIRRAAEQWRSTIDSITDMISIHDAGYRILRVNRAFADAVGMPPHELVGKNCYEVMHGTGCPIPNCPHARAVETGHAASEELFEPHLGKYFEVTTSPIINGKGAYTDSVRIAKDITESKRSKDALAASEENFRRFLDESPLGKRIVSQEGATLYVNKTALGIFDYDSLEEFRQGHPVMRYTEKSYAEFKIRREQRRRGEDGPSEYEIDIVTKQEELRNLQVWRKKILWNATDHYQVSYLDISDQKRAAIELQQSMEMLNKAVSTTVQTMAAAVETRDPYTSGHQVRSAGLACAMAAELALPEERVAAVRLAASIHDLGKLSIPSEILSKPARLSHIEFLLIKEHAEKGFEILKNVKSPWPLAEIVRQHHERMDGSGYPRNLKGEEICLEARILAVADVVESMASHRPYRPSLGLDAALKEIEQNRGILYDNAVADACLRLFREKGYQLATA